MLGNLGGWHLVVILFIILLLFGAPKLPGLAKSLGQSMKILKKEVRPDDAAAGDAKKGEESGTEAAAKDTATATAAAQSDVDAELARARAEAAQAKAEAEALRNAAEKRAEP
ncbi:MAG: twin-arginine translocase TatA/TatE family subunit [Leucobacter sp.]